MRKAIVSLLFTAIAATAAEAQAVTIDWVPVGNPGNAADTTVMTTDGTSGYGSVGYSYSIDKYDVTNSQYVEMLNAKDPTGADTLGMYNSNMRSGPYGGINYNPIATNGSKYSVISGDGNHPVNFVTFYDSIRFANWLNNGQGNGDTETGAYTLGPLIPNSGGIPVNGNSITRNSGATVVLPSENEWYKAAYYNPSNNSYFQYPTSSNMLPTASHPTAAPDSANYNGGNNLTDVGAYSGTTSPYGAYDMGGNVFQYNEAMTSGAFGGLRGGSFGTSSADLLSSTRIPAGGPSGLGSPSIGFRVAMVPEPSSFALAAFGFAGLAAWRLRRKHSATV